MNGTIRLITQLHVRHTLQERSTFSLASRIHANVLTLSFPVRNMILLLFLLCIAGGCASPGLTVTGDYHSIGFLTIGGKIPLIKAILNNKSAWFIVDTGATLTLLNAAEAKRFGFTLRHHRVGPETEVSGFANRLKISEASRCTIEIGNLIIQNYIWHTQEMNALFISIGEIEKIPIAGIIGSDILAKYRININYDTRTLSYRMKESKNL